MVEYFEREEMPGRKFFACARLKAPTLQVSSCADMWRKANHGNSEQHSRCKTCPIGAVHAGETAASMSPLMGTCVCARCHRGASRLIHRHLCISCYNRQRERVIGRNAKGAAPIKLVPLCRRRVRYVADGQVASLVLDLSQDMTELVVAVLRDSRKRVQFSFHGMPTGIRQGRLF